MAHTFLRSGRVCFARSEPGLALNDVYALLEAVSRARQEVGTALLLLWAFDLKTKRPSPNVQAALLGVLPAIVSCVDELLVALETTEAVRSALRAVFVGPPAAGAAQRLPLLFKTLDDALAHARKLAPLEVVALQQTLLKRAP